MDILTPGHIILVLVGALLIFGPKRLPDIGKSLGKGIREFKGALNHIADDEPAPSSTPAPAPPPAPAWPTAQAAVPPVDVPPVPPASSTLRRWPARSTPNPNECTNSSNAARASSATPRQEATSADSRR